MPTLSDWGGVGLLDSPSARMLPTGTVSAGMTKLRNGAQHLTLGIHPLPWLEVVARSTLALNYYGFNEPGFDLKLRLADEGEWWPAVAVGARDVTGIGFELPGKGRFAGEYLVASRRWWDVDLTLGLGWGRLGEGVGFANPLPGRLGRPRPLDGPGSHGPRGWFTGRRVALFGGVEWQTPVKDVSLKLDLPASRFAAETALDPTFPPGPSWGVALAWKPAPWADLSVGWERGRSLVRLSLTLGPEDLSAPPPHRRAPPPLSWPPERPAAALDSDTLLAVATEEGLPARAALVGDDRAVLWLDPAGADGPAARQLGRAARLLSEAAGPTTEAVTVVTGAAGLEAAAVTLPRAQVERAMARRGSPEEIWRTVEVAAAAPASPPSWSWRIMPTLNALVEQSVFEQGATHASRSTLDAGLEVEPLRGLVLDTAVRMTPGSTLAHLNAEALPAPRPVRSDVARYAQYPWQLGRLQASWLASPLPGWHTRLTGGWMEEMFAGAGAEILWKPAMARWAVGIDANQVWKREPGRRLGVLPGSRRLTGHAAAYLDSPEGGATACLRLGRYLGGDWGGTVEVGHRFTNGVRIVAYGTWTDGPREGQSPLSGHIDHGIRVIVPLGTVAMPMADRVAGGVEVAMRTLGRDAGQRLEQPWALHDRLTPAGFGAVAGSWDRLMD